MPRSNGYTLNSRIGSIAGRTSFQASRPLPPAGPRRAFRRDRLATISAGCGHHGDAHRRLRRRLTEGGLADRERRLDGDAASRELRIAEPLEEELGGEGGATLGPEVDTRQRRNDQLADLGVVHSHDGDVAGDRHAVLPEHLEGGDGEQIVGTHDGVRCRLRQQLLDGDDAGVMGEVVGLDLHLRRRRQPEGVDVVDEAAEAGGAGHGVDGAVDEGDAPAPLFDEMLEGEPDAGGGVGADVVEVHAGGQRADDHDRMTGGGERGDQLVGDPQRDEDEAVAIAVVEAVEEPELIVGAGAGRGDDEAVAGVARGRR